MAEKCYKGGTKHSFQPRYEEVPVHGIRIPSISARCIEDIRSLYIRKEYVKDVCKWCGKTIEK